MKINIRIFTLSYTFKNKPIFLDKNGRYMIAAEIRNIYYLLCFDGAELEPNHYINVDYLATTGKIVRCRG